MGIWNTNKIIQTLHDTAEELRTSEVVASVGNGEVTIVLSGDRHVKSIKIAPESVRRENASLLQEQVLAAYRECIDATKELSAAKGADIKNLFG